MQQSRTLVVALLAVVLGAVAWLWLLRPVEGTPTTPLAPADATAKASATAAAAVDAAAAAAAGEQAGEQRVEATPATAAQTTTTLRIRALWPDEQPAVGVMIYLRRGERGLPYTAFAHGLTDADGVVVLADVRPGTVRLASDRGDRKKVEIEAGTQEVTFELKGGIAVQGTVRGPGHPGGNVAGAEVWLQTSGTTWSGGRVVAFTDTDGSFALEHIPTGHSLGAVASNFGPSPLVDLDITDTSNPPATVVLELRPLGGNLTGQVTDHTGAPVAGAVVAAGSSPRFQDYRGERVIEQWGVRTTETDDEGHFTLLGLATGPMAVAIRACGYGLWREQVTITAGEMTTIAPRLLASATLLGTVTDADGAPLTEARVRAYDREPRTPFLAGGQIDFDETFGYRAALTNAAGEYRMAGITPGTVHVFAQRKSDGRDGKSVAYTRAELEVEAGSETTWDAVIDDGRSIEGIVLYGDGYPIPGLFITLADEHSEQEHVIVSDRQGVFRFLCLEDTTYEIRVQLWDAPKGEPPLKAAGVVPDRGRTELRVSYDKPVKKESGKVLGRIDDVGQRISNPLATRVVLHSDARWFREDGKIIDGAFEFDRVTPCRFRLTLMEGESALAHSDWFELPAAGVVDVGVITTEPGGSVRIRAVRTPGAETLEPKLYLKREGDPRSTVVALGLAAQHTIENLTPGDYELTGYVTGMVPLQGTFTVTAGTVSETTVVLHRGARCVFEVWWPEGHTGSSRRGYRFLDIEGTVLHEYESSLSTSPTRPYKLTRTMPPGRWTLEFWSDDGLRGDLQFTVPSSLEDVQQRLDLQ